MTTSQNPFESFLSATSTTPLASQSATATKSDDRSAGISFAEVFAREQERETLAATPPDAVEVIEYPVHVAGSRCARLFAHSDSSHEELKCAASALPEVVKAIGDAIIAEITISPGELINILLEEAQTPASSGIPVVNAFADDAAGVFSFAAPEETVPTVTVEPAPQETPGETEAVETPEGKPKRARAPRKPRAKKADSVDGTPVAPESVTVDAKKLALLAPDQAWVRIVELTELVNAAISSLSDRVASRSASIADLESQIEELTKSLAEARDHHTAESAELAERIRDRAALTKARERTEAYLLSVADGAPAELGAVNVVAGDSGLAVARAKGRPPLGHEAMPHVIAVLTNLEEEKELIDRADLTING